MLVNAIEVLTQCMYPPNTIKNVEETKYDWKILLDKLVLIYGWALDFIFTAHRTR